MLARSGVTVLVLIVCGLVWDLVGGPESGRTETTSSGVLGTEPQVVAELQDYIPTPSASEPKQGVQAPPHLVAERGWTGHRSQDNDFGPKGESVNDLYYALRYVLVNFVCWVVFGLTCRCLNKLISGRRVVKDSAAQTKNTSEQLTKFIKKIDASFDKESRRHQVIIDRKSVV